MAPRPHLPGFFVPLSIAVSFSALALAAIGASGLSCGDARLYPLQFPVTDGGAGMTGGRGGGGGGGSSGGGGGGSGGNGGATDASVDATDGGDGSIVPITCPNTAVVGFATLTSSGADGGPPQMGTNGGGALPATTVTTLDAFTTLVGDKTPRVLRISGIIPFPPAVDGGTTGMQVKVASNKTIVGADANSGFSGGGLFIDGSQNVIVRNLKISGAFHTDAITVQASTNVWIDHCDLSCDPVQPNACDGLVDVTHASDFVTVSWTYYHDHNASGLVGHSDNNAAEDTNHLTVTYHHDLFTNVFSGPRMRFGSVHLFNVDFEHLGDYAIASTMSASVYVERCVFNDVRTPITTMVTTSQPMPGFVAEGMSDAANSYLPPNSPADNIIMTSPTSWRPQYVYSQAFTSLTDVQTVVQACAGTGKFAPLPIPP